MTDVSNFRAPFDSVPFAGLGSWPGGRSYWDVSNFRAPYEGNLMNATLQGLGANTPVVPAADSLPDRFRRYVMTGESMSNVLGTAQTATNQVPRWAWALMVLGAGALAYRSYKAHQRQTG